MGIPFEMLIGFVEEPDICSIPIAPRETGEEVVSAEIIPKGDSPEEIIWRRTIISRFFR